MLEVHTLPGIVKRSKKRLGQGHGSGRVKTSGRGTKGQNARNKVPAYFEGGALPLTKRLPFLRGKDKNKVFKIRPIGINLEVISKLPAKEVINVKTLIAHGLVDKVANKLGVKILGKGNIENAYTVQLPTTKSAAEKIVKAGGTVTV